MTPEVFYPFSRVSDFLCAQEHGRTAYFSLIFSPAGFPSPKLRAFSSCGFFHIRGAHVILCSCEAILASGPTTGSQRVAAGVTLETFGVRTRADGCLWT